MKQFVNGNPGAMGAGILFYLNKNFCLYASFYSPNGTCLFHLQMAR